jgi:hypothetical protein
MITFSNLGKMGNLGNQLFQIASTIGIANKNGHDYRFPKWKYAEFFKQNFPELEKNSDIDFNLIQEKKFDYYYWTFGSENYDIRGYLQTEKYFNINETKKIFEFKESFIKPIISKYNFLTEKKNIIISVRRGDFVNHKNYYQLSYKYYFSAILMNFPDWKERNLIFMSDDIAYCKFHFKFLLNAYFIDNLSPIEQLAFSSIGNDFIISNSTFSWWIAWLSEKKDSIVIRPKKVFRGEISKTYYDRDYFPERWSIFEYNRFKVFPKYFNLYIRGGLFQTKLDIVDFILNINYIIIKIKAYVSKVIIKIVKIINQ